MIAEEKLREGDLKEALARLQDEIRRDPGNARYRIFLFQLLCLLGDWRRALTQLKVAGEIDPLALPMAQTYREALHCELLRAAVFAGRRTPLVFGEPADWVAWMIEALRRDADGRGAEAQDLRDRAFEAASAVPGRIGDEAFAWIADADPRLGPILEAVVDGRYWWVPFERIRAIRMEPPEDLRDLVWMPAQFQWANGGESVGLVPTRYPGSEASEDAAIRMSRRTDWIEAPSGLQVGLGQRMFATDAAEHPLLDLREVTLEAGPPADAAHG